MKTLDTMIIFSLDLKDRPANTKQVQAYLSSLVGPNGFKPLIGSYNGITENSYIMPAEGNLDLIKSYATMYGQESIMLLHGDNHAELVYLNGPRKGERQGLGTLKAVSEAEARRQLGWTLDPSNGQYYTVV